MDGFGFRRRTDAVPAQDQRGPRQEPDRTGDRTTGTRRTPRNTRLVHIPDLLARLWSDEAGQGLSRRRPELSARAGLTPMQGWCLVGAGLALTAGFAWQPIATAALASTLLGVVFASLIVLRVTACVMAPRWAARQNLPDNALPPASIILALYKEAAILPALAAALARIDYPADRFEILLAIEADDAETLEAALALELDARFQIVAVPPGLPRTKPRALNYALRLCRGEIITILDAEDRPHPGQLRCAAESFAAAGPDLACLQAPLNWYNREQNWLTRQFALEYAAHFHALLPLYQRLGWPLPLGGTSNHFRREALRRTGGWDAWNVTEDADLGFRLHRLGYRCGLIAPMTMEEAPVRAWPWICQRTRWLKGYAQTLGVHLRNPGTTARSGALPGLVLSIGAGLASALLHAPLAAICLWCLLAGDLGPVSRWLAPACLSGGYLAAALCAATGMRRAGLPVRLGDLATMPFYWPLQTLAGLRAMWQLLTNPFYWDKTEHGVSPDATATCTSPSTPRFTRSAPASPSSSSPDGVPASPPGRKRDRA